MLIVDTHCCYESRTIAQLCRTISSQLRHISTVGKKLVKQQYLPHISLQYGELRPTSGWDCFVSLKHPSKFQRLSRLGSITARYSSSGRQPNFAVLNRGRHLHSAGRPSRWASAHILVYILYNIIEFMRAVNMIWISFSMMSLTYHMQNYMAVLCEMPTIHYLARSPTVWPQYMYTKVTDRTDRQWLDRIGQTVLQTVAQNSADRHTWHDLHVVSHLGFPMKVPPHVLSSESCDISDDYSLSLSFGFITKQLF